MERNLKAPRRTVYRKRLCHQCTPDSSEAMSRDAHAVLWLPIVELCCFCFDLQFCSVICVPCSVLLSLLGTRQDTCQSHLNRLHPSFPPSVSLDGYPGRSLPSKRTRSTSTLTPRSSWTRWTSRTWLASLCRPHRPVFDLFTKLGC